MSKQNYLVVLTLPQVLLSRYDTLNSLIDLVNNVLSHFSYLAIFLYDLYDKIRIFQIGDQQCGPS